ncbi:MAG: hypothetical protein GF355_07795 [Candidatus Eisenbacteria bacterium]|nr:hypothetical protein [Candidatus Eisenbacteria bacterium]
MTPTAEVKRRYLRDEPQVRLGGLASNLARVRSFSQHPDHEEEVARLIDESAHFIEWTAADVGDEARLALLELQRQLVRWRRFSAELWRDQNRREKMAQDAAGWSQRILRLAGYLPD